MFTTLAEEMTDAELREMLTEPENAEVARLLIERKSGRPWSDEEDRVLVRALAAAGFIT